MIMTSQADIVTKEKTTAALKEPGMYKVLFINDDVTPMDFVVETLVQFFKHSVERANSITQQVHNNGSAVAGVYTYEIAEQKASETLADSRSRGYSLQVELEKE